MKTETAQRPGKVSVPKELVLKSFLKNNIIDKIKLCQFLRTKV